MDLGRPANTTEARALVGIFQYYTDMLTRQCNILAPLTEVASDPKHRKYCVMMC